MHESMKIVLWHLITDCLVLSLPVLGSTKHQTVITATQYSAYLLHSCCVVVRKWNVKPQAYGKPWVAGDVIGCSIDLDTGAITFYRNGESLGVAYDKVRTMQTHLAYFPAVSLSHAERCQLNFGARPFAYPVQGYQPLHAAPSQQQQRVASYYCECLSRLSGIALNGPATSAAPPAAASLISHSLHKHGVHSALPGSPTAMQLHAQSRELLFRHAPLEWCDIVLLATCASEPLQVLLHEQRYSVHSALLPVLVDLYRRCEPHQPELLNSFIRLLELTMQQEVFEGCMTIVLEALARK